VTVIVVIVSVPLTLTDAAAAGVGLTVKLPIWYGSTIVNAWGLAVAPWNVKLLGVAAIGPGGVAVGVCVGVGEIGGEYGGFVG
jgi:hypothetical protein